MSGHKDYYVYVIYRTNGVPCYVGMGRGQRWKAHAYGSHNKHLAAIYAKSGGNLPILKVKQELTHKEACAAEIALIAKIGRADKKVGPLVNFTDGGEGQPGAIPSKETRRKRSLAMTGKKLPPRSLEYRKRQSESHKGKAHPNSIAAILGARKGIKQSPEQIQRRMESMKRTNPERIKKIAAALRRPKTPAEIAAMPQLQKGVPKSEEQKRKMALARIGRKLSPEHRAAIGAAHRGKKRASVENMRAAQQRRSAELRAEAFARERNTQGRFL